MTPNLEFSDLMAAVRLVDRATDPSKALLTPDRRRLLIEGLVKLVGADMWIWSVTVLNHEVTGDVMTTCVMDGGWRTSAEQARVYEILSSPDFNTRGMQSVYQAFARREHATFLTGEVFPPEAAQELTELWKTTGFENYLLATHPLNANFSSNLGLHRRQGKSDFGPREKAIVDAVYHGIDWLHRYGVHEEAGPPAMQLSPRERQALIMLLSGCSNTEIARRMGITAHTVKDYVRRIHKRFGVGSRAELQSYFFVGAPNRPPREVDLGN